MKKLIALTLSILLLTGCGAAVYNGPTKSEWVLTEDFTTHYDPETGESYTTHDTYSYDSYGNQVRWCSYEGDKLMYELRSTYDDRYNCLREVTYERIWGILVPTNRASFTYDDQDRSLSSVFRNGFGIKTEESHYTYDDEANTITLDSTYDTHTIYFDENDDHIRTVTISKPAGIQTETFEEFDELGRTTKTEEYTDGILTSYVEYRFDDEGRLAEQTCYNGHGQVLSGFTMVYEENTVTTWYRDGSREFEVLRPDNRVEYREYYDPAGKLRWQTASTYTEIQVPGWEE